MSQALCFNNVTLSPVTHQNNLWIRAVELARALGYKREDQVAKIYRTNSDEFTPDMAQVVEILDNAESAFPVKSLLFSLRGCHLLAMFARTPVAKAFRKWVLDVLDTLAAEERARLAGDVKALPDPVTTVTPSTTSSRKPLEKLVKVWASQSDTPHAQCWTMLNAAFNLRSIAELPEEWIPDAIIWVQGKIDALPKGLPEHQAPELPQAPRRDAPAVLKVTERECQRLTDDITRAHIEAMRLLKPVKDRLCNIALRLAIETEQRAEMRALRHGEGESLQGMLFAGTGRMFAEAVMYPNEYELPVYCNPGFFLLGICRQLRARDRA